MAYAIIETCGKQLLVEPGRFYDVDRLKGDPDEKIALDKVLLVEHDGEVNIGQPFLENATVNATVLQHLRGRKVIVYKMQPKKKTRKKRGHRQELTRFMVDSIQLNGSVFAADEATVDTEPVVDSMPAAAEEEGNASVVDTTPETVEDESPDAPESEVEAAATESEGGES